MMIIVRGSISLAFMSPYCRFWTWIAILGSSQWSKVTLNNCSFIWTLSEIFDSFLKIWSFHAFFCRISLADTILKPAWSSPCAFTCIWTKLCLCAKTASKLVSNPSLTFSEILPMCSSRGRLWISCEYAHNHWMMFQLAMALKVCRNASFRQNSVLSGWKRFDRPSWRSDRCWRSDRPWWRSDRPKWSVAVRPGNAWRSDRPWLKCEFWAGPKIECVGLIGDPPTLGLIIFGASRQKFYSFEISSRFRSFKGWILAKSFGAVRPAMHWRSDRWHRSDRPWGAVRPVFT